MPAGAWKDLTAWWRDSWNGAPDPIDYWRGPERDPARDLTRDLHLALDVAYDDSLTSPHERRPTLQAFLG